MPQILLLLATVAGLLALAAWWVRRTNLAVQRPGRRPPQLRPLPAGCELGAQLMVATATDSATPERTGPPQAETAPAPAKAPRRQVPSGPSRREFLRKSWLLAWLGTLGGFAGASIAFLWPSLKGGFGARIDVDTEEAILQRIQQNREPYAYPAGRMYLVAYDPALDAEGQYAEVTNNGQSKVMALYQRCVHLGCRVPWCLASQWFECPCHGSRYNRWGEYEFGPAPRGLDRFPLTVENGRVIVDTSQIITGPSRQSGMLDQPPEGPHCN